VDSGVWACACVVWWLHSRSSPDASLPKPLLDFSNHLRSLAFQAKPDYAFLESCLDGAVGSGASDQHVYEFQRAREAAAAEAAGLGTSQGGGSPGDQLDRGAFAVTPSSSSSLLLLPRCVSARARENHGAACVLPPRILCSSRFCFESRCLLDSRYTQPHRHVDTGCDPLCVCGG
jgi:hypothetical protein